MAKINDTTSYPNTTPVLADHIPGTDISNTTNDANGETVTFTMQAVMDLFEANFAAPASAITSGTLANARLAAALEYIGGLTPATDQIPFFDSASTAALTAFSNYSQTLLAGGSEAVWKANLNLEIGTDVEAALTVASQAEMEAWTEAALLSMSHLRVSQAISALGGS